MIGSSTAKLLGLLYMLPAFAQPIPSTSATDNTNMACVEHLQIPTYPPLARQARLAGTLVVTVELSADATVRNVTAESKLNNNGARIVLERPTEIYLRKSQFSKECAGKTVVLLFEFQINGDPNDRQQQEVAFGYPNRFFITARPPLMANNAP